MMTNVGISLILVVCIVAVNSQNFRYHNSRQFQTSRPLANRWRPQVNQHNPIQRQIHNFAQFRPDRSRQTLSQRQTAPVQRSRNFFTRNSGRSNNQQDQRYRPQFTRPDVNLNAQRGRFQQTSQQPQSRFNSNARFPAGRQQYRRDQMNRNSPFMMQNWNSFTETDGNVRHTRRQTAATPRRTVARQPLQPQRRVSYVTETRYDVDDDIDVDVEDLFSYGRNIFRKTGMVFGNNDFDRSDSDSYYFEN